MTIEEEQARDHNKEHQIGDLVDYTLDSGHTWTRSELASRAFLRDKIAVVRVKGYGAPLPFKNLAIVPKNWD